MNFINDDGFAKFFEEIIFSGKSKLQNLYVFQNNFTPYKALQVSKEVQDKGIKIYVDQFEKLFYQNEDRLKRTLWFGPLQPDQKDEFSHQNILDMLKLFNVKKTGLYSMPVRYRKAQKIAVKKSETNQYMFVEFESEDGVHNVTRLVGKKSYSFVKKAYIAGSNTFVRQHRSIQAKDK